jgi:hypothetical protein
MSPRACCDPWTVLAFAPDGTLDGAFENGLFSRGFGVDESGLLYVSGSGSGDPLQVFDPHGNEVATFGSLESPGHIGVGYGVVCAENWYDNHSLLNIYTRSGSRLWSGGQVCGGLRERRVNCFYVSAVDVGPDGSVFVLSSWRDEQGEGDHGIQKFNSGLQVRWSTPSHATEFMNQGDVAVDANGRVYVIGGGMVQVYAPAVTTPAIPATWGQVKSRWR